MGCADPSDPDFGVPGPVLDQPVAGVYVSDCLWGPPAPQPPRAAPPAASPRILGFSLASVAGAMAVWGVILWSRGWFSTP